MRAGAPAFALIKASPVIVVAGAQDARFSARNCLLGTVAKVVPGAVNTQMMIDLLRRSSGGGHHYQGKR